MIAQIQHELAARYAGALTTANTAERQAQFNTLQTMQTHLSAVHPTRCIFLHMKPDSTSTSDIPQFPLEDEDNFYVPATLGVVQVSGAVYTENAFRAPKAKAAFLAPEGGRQTNAPGGRQTEFSDPRRWNRSQSVKPQRPLAQQLR